MAQAKGLGKGISALLEDEENENPSAAKEGDSSIQAIDLEQIQPGRYQPRRHFEDTQLQELADSIAANGVMQPVVLRKTSDSAYEIIAGERRWRASKLAGVMTIPAIVRELTDQQALELALIENIQRQDLNPIEEAQGYQRLMDEFNYTQEALAAAVGKSRSHVANLLRLLQLPEDIKKLVDEGKLSMGHARALLSAEEPLPLAQRIIKEELSVRQAEALIQGRGEKAAPKPPKAPKPSPSSQVPVQKDEDIIALEQTLSDNIGLKVEINDRGQHGEVVIAYDSLEQLDDVLRRLGGVS